MGKGVGAGSRVSPDILFGFFLSKRVGLRRAMGSDPGNLC